MRNRTRVVLKVDGANGITLSDGGTSIPFQILPDTSAQIEVGKKYLIYLSKVILFGVLSTAVINLTDAVTIEGLSTDSNNIILKDNVEKLPIIGIYNLIKGNENLGITKVVWENPHPKDDGIICSNPYNKLLKLRVINIDATTPLFTSLTSAKIIFEIMVEEICDC